MFIVDTSENITTREEFVSIVDFIPPTMNLFTTTSHVTGQITLDVDVIDNPGGDIFCFAPLYCIFDEDNELDYYYVELVNGVGNVTFTDLDPERTYIVELLVRDNAWNSRIERREIYPNGQGVVIGNPEHWWEILTGNVDFWVRSDDPIFIAIRFRKASAFAPGGTFKKNDAAFASTMGATRWAPYPRGWVDPLPTNWVESNVKNSDHNDRRMAVEEIENYINSVSFWF